MGGVGGSWTEPEPLAWPLGPAEPEAAAAAAAAAPEAEVDELVYDEGGEAEEASRVEGGGVGQPVWAAAAEPYRLGSIDIHGCGYGRCIDIRAAAEMET